uniref:Putative deoxyribonuclease i n=1 Tax=Lutzomyia longipalpis TaxID=7200 RepID=A0A7G3AIG7_LUTLO
MLSVYAILAALAVTFPGHFSAEIGSNCNLPFKPVPYGFFAPLIYGADEKFSEASTNESTVLEPQESVTLSCEPGYFKSYPKTRTLKAKCIGGEELQLEDGSKELWSKNFACDLRPVEEVLTPNLPGCPPEAEGTEFGYINPFTKKSIIIGEACYNVTKGQIIFVHAKTHPGLKIEDQNYLQRGSHPESRNKLEFFKALRYDAIYDRFKNVFGPPEKVLRIIYRSLLTAQMLSLPQLHLVNRLTWNYAISHDDESLAGWTALRDGVEKFTAENAAADVWIGTSGVAKVVDVAGTAWDFYLQHPKFPVPKYHWIIVKVNNKATGFLFYNIPPFLNTRSYGNEEPKILEKICQRKCKEFSWLEGVEGIRCCSVEEMRQVIPEIPPISGVLGELPPKQEAPQGESMIS